MGLIHIENGIPLTALLLTAGQHSGKVLAHKVKTPGKVLYTSSKLKHLTYPVTIHHWDLNQWPIFRDSQY